MYLLLIVLLRKKVLIKSRYKPDDNNINYQVMFELSKNSAEK